MYIVDVIHPPQERGLIFRLLVICMLQYDTCLRKETNKKKNPD